MKNKLTVAVLMGGPSAEAEVSRVSGREVAAGLTRAGHNAQLLELNADAAGRLLEMQPDVVFPALHGPPGEDGTVQGFLEILGFAYVGSDVHGSAAAMDKHIAKSLFRRAGLPVAEDVLIAPDADVAGAVTDVGKLGKRVVIKPLRQGSALGVTLVTAPDDLAQALAEALSQALAFGHGVLVETFVAGREITVGVLDLQGAAIQALPVIEVTTANDEWYDYTNRYTAGGSKHLIPAPLDADVGNRLQQIAVSAHRSLGLRDLSRADFILTEDGGIVLLEVNTLPGMTPTSLYPDAADAMGLNFGALMDALVVSAFERTRTT